MAYFCGFQHCSLSPQMCPRHDKYRGDCCHPAVVPQLKGPSDRRCAISASTWRSKRERCPSCALEANPSRNLTRNPISPLLSRSFKWETYVLAICFFRCISHYFGTFLSFFQCRDVCRHTNIYIYMLV